MVDPDEVAHHEPPHLDLHCLPFVLQISIWYSLLEAFSLKFADINFVVCFWAFLGLRYVRACAELCL